jgi:membrane-bound lytic murein transglycosylase MltF
VRARLFACLIGFCCAIPAHAPAQEAAGQVLSDPVQAATDEDPPSLMPANDAWIGDLDGMRARKRIRILVPYSKTFYFIDKGGKQFGATYDTGRAFEEWLNTQDNAKTLQTSVVFIPVARDRLLPGLIDGTGDIAAGNLTITDERAKMVQFAHPLVKGVREILVTGPAAPAIASLDDLGGKQIFLRPSSSYFEHLNALNETLEASGKQPIALVPIDEELEDEDLMEMVNAGLLPWTVVDEHKAKIWSAVFIDMAPRTDIVIHEGGEIAWAMRKDSPLLRKVLDEFADAHKLGTTFGNMLKKRYMGAQSPALRATSEEELRKFEQLVAIFRQYGKEYDFDALMLAAQGYQESKLDQSARSHRGAVGVMQLMPSTAADPSIGIAGIDSDPDRNVHAGVKYMRLLVDKYLDDPALDDKNRTLMAFAAYNAGPGNLRTLRNLPAESGLDPNVGLGNVEHAAADVVGRETVQYVSNIYKYYVAYRLATERSQERSKAREAVAPTP